MVAHLNENVILFELYWIYIPLRDVKENISLMSKQIKIINEAPL